MYIEVILSLLISYFLGSIPFALVIGKIFYKTDVRNYGSKNLGGTNTGRVLGKKAGLAVMTCDMLKATLAIYLASHLENAHITMVVAGLGAAIGHCYPIFAGFKGGKAVAVLYGFLLGMAFFTECSFGIFLIPLVIALVVLYFTKIVSIASISGAVGSTVYIMLTNDFWMLWVASVILTFIVVIRHRSNIQRVMGGTENKITWM